MSATAMFQVLIGFGMILYETRAQLAPGDDVNSGPSSNPRHAGIRSNKKDGYSATLIQRSARQAFTSRRLVLALEA